MNDPDYPRLTRFQSARVDAVIVEAWFDEVPNQSASLWLEANDGARVCVPADRMEMLKRLIRRGRNP